MGLLLIGFNVAEKRGLYYEDELTALVELAGTPNDLQQQAAKALALFLHGTPSEFTLSNETISSSIAQSKDCLVYMLDEAEKGNVRFAISPRLRVDPDAPLL
jgi:hypothetical protein